MFRETAVYTGLLVLSAIILFARAAQPIESDVRAPTGSPLQIVGLPGTGFEITLGAPALDPGPTRVKPELLAAIAAWLARNYALPPMDELPAVALASRDAMTALRHGDGHPHGWSYASTVAALYDDADRTIYLPESWTGSTPAELSMLVHEMVHHLQNKAAMTFACSEEREQLAYAAQRDWLALFGRDLLADFDMDAFTLMVRTHCLY